MVKVVRGLRRSMGWVEGNKRFMDGANETQDNDSAQRI